MQALALKLNSLRGLSRQQWLEAGVRVAPAVVSTVLVVALAWQLAQVTWLFLGSTASSSQPSLNAAAATPRSTAPSVIDLSRIVDAHLFGIPSPDSGPGDVSAAPQTQMNLVLTGTMAGNDPQKGFAIVGESAVTAKTFSTGATLRPGTKLHSVYTDRVILDNGGRFETLILPRQSTGGATMARPVPLPAAASGGIGDDLRRIAETNPDDFLAVVRPQPVFANGVQRGYRVYPGRDRRQFTRLGLQPGDLVTSVNGTPLDDPARGMEILNTLNSASQVNVTVERNGQSQQLLLNTAQLSTPDPVQPADAPPDASAEVPPAPGSAPNP